MSSFLVKNNSFSDLAPIVLFVYNRAECALKTLEHLKQNILADQSELFIYSDGPKTKANQDDIDKILMVREIIRKDKWCKKVHIFESTVNLGLADSIIKGVTEMISRFRKVIVLEDDLLTTVHYLEYMNKGLKLYENEEKVFQIVGYNAPIKIAFKNESFFLPITSTLGWGTWERAWKYFEKNPSDYSILKTDRRLRRKFDLDNSYPYSNMLIKQMETGLDSWGIRWWWTVFKQQGISLFPDRTLIAHIGFTPDATHTQYAMIDFNKLWIPDYSIKHFPETIEVNYNFYSKVKRFYNKRSKRSIRSISKSILRLIKDNLSKVLKSGLLI